MQGKNIRYSVELVNKQTMTSPFSEEEDLYSTSHNEDGTFRTFNTFLKRLKQSHLTKSEIPSFKEIHDCEK